MALVAIYGFYRRRSSADRLAEFECGWRETSGERSMYYFVLGIKYIIRLLPGGIALWHDVSLATCYSYPN